MRKFGFFFGAGAIVVCAAISAARATEILKEEPHVGMLVYPNTVLVDNGKCPAGQVQQITGGMNPRRGGGQMMPRQYKCVPRPTQ
ncbi:MAG TPA: DUF6719 family protein [Acetobacteraceae bacterium]|jgi:hypothetical protein|nr:DUF6719 family protein [Acetobacteraceae bacterium]